MAVNTAPVKWAQRVDSIYLTLDLPDVKDEQLKLTKDMLSFRREERKVYKLAALNNRKSKPPLPLKEPRQQLTCRDCIWLGSIACCVDGYLFQIAARGAIRCSFVHGGRAFFCSCCLRQEDLTLWIQKELHQGGDDCLSYCPVHISTTGQIKHCVEGLWAVCRSHRASFRCSPRRLFFRAIWHLSYDLIQYTFPPTAVVQTPNNRYCCCL